MKFFSYVLVAALGFAVAFFATNVDDWSADTYDFSNTENVQTETQESSGYSTYYEQLTDFQKSIYDAAIETIAAAKQTFELKNINIADFRKNSEIALIAIQYDHPEYFWFTGGYVMTLSHKIFKETGTVKVEPTYYEYASGMFSSEKKQAQLMKRVDEIAELARNHSADGYERILFVHDYLIENAYYDMDGLKEYYKSSHNPSCEYIFSAYGCLVDGKTVCSGYAKAFQLILQRLGYQCSYVTGDAGEAHGWNCVYLDGEGYYVDITWDDMDLEEEVPMYNYAFINGEELNRTHTVDMEFDAPVCNATEYNFHRKHNYFLETYDYDAAIKILTAQSDGDAAYIKFGSLEELGRAYEALIKKDKLKKVKALKDFTESHYNESQRTLTIIKK